MAGVAKHSSAVLLIICGAINALLSKIVYQLEAPDCNGNVKPFEKPWLQTALMFIAMALCLPIAWIQQHWNSMRHHQQQQGHSNSTQGVGQDLESPASSHAEVAASAVAKAADVAARAAQHAKVSPAAAAAAAAAAAPAPAGNQPAADPLTEPLLAGSHTQQQLQQHAAGRGDHNGSSRQMSRMKEALLLCVPTGFDLAATTLMNVGLLYVAASVFQILRGAEMIFAALFAVTFLHRPLNRWHYMGVALCMAGIGCVGASRMLAGDSSSVDLPAPAHHLPSAAGSIWQQLWGDGGDSGGGGDAKLAFLGMGLILLSQAIQAGQVTVEDHLMSDLAMQPLLVVGWEGLIGSIVMLGGALPLLQALPYRDGSGFAEDTVGSWCMIRSSAAIAGALGFSTFAVLLYNIFGMYVTENVGAAARVVLENARTLLVWVAALALYYTHVGGGKVGEHWDQWSWLQAVGFAVFAAGAYLYNKGHKQLDEDETAAGKVPKYSKWAVLKSTLSISTGHRVAARRFRVAGAAVLAGVRAGRMTDSLDSIAEVHEA